MYPVFHGTVSLLHFPHLIIQAESVQSQIINVDHCIVDCSQTLTKLIFSDTQFQGRNKIYVRI